MANGSTLGTAYVQIVPSAQGIKGSIEAAFGDEPNKAGANIGKSISGTIKTAIVAAGIGAAVAKSLSAGGELQQSLGGVETMFGEASDRVIANADKAFRTAGLSANGYLQQVTSFSATLLQGLQGDTEAAVDYADMAIIDMSDNANKFGTNISSIQAAYQGFAKDNYTMLDNLKLGYGGTASEMARLINDTKVLGDDVTVTAQTVKDVPFDKVIEAIHKVQSDLGVTGTTSIEAAETFSGSMGSMKAALENVFANAALGRDMQPALEGLANSIKSFFLDNLFPMIQNILKSLPEIIQILSDVIKPMMPDIISGVVQILTAVLTTLIEFIPEIIDAGLEMAGALIDALTKVDWGSVGMKILDAIKKGFEKHPIASSILLAFGGMKFFSMVTTGIQGIGSALGGLFGPHTIALAAIAAVAAGVAFMKGEIDKAIGSFKGLHDEMTGLKAGYDETHEQITKANEILDSNMSKTEKVAAIQELLTAAQTANATATSANAKATDSLSKVQDVQVSTGAKMLAALGGLNLELIAEAEATAYAADTINTSNDVMETASDDVTYLEGVLADLESQEDVVGDATGDMAGAIDTAAGVVDAFARTTKKSASQIALDTKDSMSKVASAVSDMKDAISGAVKGITGWYDELEAKSHRTTDTLITNWENQIHATETWEHDLETLVSMGMDQGLVQQFAKAGPAGDEMMMALQDALINDPDALPGLIAKCNELFEKQWKLEEGMNDEAQGVIHAVGVMSAGSERELAEMAAQAMKYGAQLPKGVAEAIMAASPNVKTAAITLKNMAISQDLFGPGYNIGTNMVMGVVRGINDHADSAVNAAAAMSNRTISKTRNIMAIQSPSKVFEEIGKYVDMGLALGIERNANTAINQAAGMADDVTDAVRGITDQRMSFSAGYSAYPTNAQAMATGNNYSDSITLNVYGAKGQSEEALARIVMNMLQHQVNKKGAAWA